MEITDACTTDAGETPAISALQSAFGDCQASAAGATTVEITTACTTTQARRLLSRLTLRSPFLWDAGETPAFLAAPRSPFLWDAGETPAFQANAAFTLPLGRRRDACVLCFAERLKAMARLTLRSPFLWDAGETPAFLAAPRSPFLWDAGEDACFPGCAVGATLVEITTACGVCFAGRKKATARG